MELKYCIKDYKYWKYREDFVRYSAISQVLKKQRQQRINNIFHFRKISMKLIIYSYVGKCLSLQGVRKQLKKCEIWEGEVREVCVQEKGGEGWW